VQWCAAASSMAELHIAEVLVFLLCDESLQLLPCCCMVRQRCTCTSPCDSRHFLLVWRILNDWSSHVLHSIPSCHVHLRHGCATGTVSLNALQIDVAPRAAAEALAIQEDDVCG
jgi:hypothetical protein